MPRNKSRRSVSCSCRDVDNRFAPCEHPPTERLSHRVLRCGSRSSELFTGKETNLDQAASKPGSVHRSFPVGIERIGDHSSGTALADRLTRPTRTERYGAPVERLPKDWLDARPYSVLLQAGLALPLLSPEARCALTAPFHPYCSGFPEKRFAFCGAIPRVGATSLSPFPGWTLSTASPSWSPDFPPAAIP
jgi:hypothetical protein